MQIFIFLFWLHWGLEITHSHTLRYQLSFSLGTVSYIYLFLVTCVLKSRFAIQKEYTEKKKEKRKNQKIKLPFKGHEQTEPAALAIDIFVKIGLFAVSSVIIMESLSCLSDTQMFQNRKVICTLKFPSEKTFFDPTLCSSDYWPHIPMQVEACY